MERTGTSFEMNPSSFTLENMFAMELHKYANVIGDIVTSAVKELSIEKVNFTIILPHWRSNKVPLVYLRKKEVIFLIISSSLNAIKETVHMCVVCVLPGSEGDEGDLGKHEVHCAALF